MAYSTKYDKKDYLQAVKKYRRLEIEMHTMALKMATAWGETNLLNPEFTDEYNFPVNVYARKMKQALDEKKDKKILRELAQDSEIYIFLMGGCEYCPKMEKHLNRFAKKYGFKVEAVSLNKYKSKYFKTTMDLELARALDVKIAPTVFLVNKNDNHRYQIAIGVMSIQELEENSLQASKLMKEGISNVGKK
ncbi:MAG: conjugal transfer protein TraF [Gammaproteobacteria bacterium]|nr:conjugal transfer protein TraF [Gammaproteobacteria bacterium]